MMTQGTLVDATIIEATSSTKNKEQQRDPEKPFQTKVKLCAIILKDNKKSKNDFLYQTGVRVITMKHKRTMPGLTPSVYCRDVRQDDGLK